MVVVGINSVKDKCIFFVFMCIGNGENNLYVLLIFLKVWVDGFMGLLEWIRWKDYLIVVVICGGLGVSFGVVVCEYVCMFIKN